MIKTLFIVSLVLTTFCFSQTAGTLSLTFTQTPHTSYTGTKNVMAVWIQSSTGSFVKTRARNVGNGTNDHLPTWAVNAGGTANNCLSANCNVVGAVTGATLNNFATRTFSWDGTDVSGNQVPDGTYRITVESTWNHGANGSTVTTYNFVKGANPDVQSPANDANFTSIALAWNPSGAELTPIEPLSFSLLPNPSVNGKVTISGVLSLDFITVFDLKGGEVFTEKVSSEGLIELDLSNQTPGTYLVKVTRGFVSKEERIVIQ